MSSPADVLLERAVRVDAWLRTTDCALVHPVSAMLLLVLVGLLVLAILRASRQVILAVVASRVVPVVPSVPVRRTSDAPPLGRLAPIGGRGARAPAGRWCRPIGASAVR